MFDISKFGNYLSKLRKNADMTQSELAEKLGVTHQAVSRYERGHCFPDISILILMADAFGITIDEMMRPCELTDGEAKLLGTVAVGNTDVVPDNISDILHLAPVLKPSVLEKLSKNCKQNGIDITSLVKLAEYLNDEAVISLMENVEFDSMNEELLQKLLPILDKDSKAKIFEKILDGELNSKYIKILLPYAEYLTPQIEAAVVYGVLPSEVLDILEEYYWDEKGYRYKNGQ